MDRHQAGRCKLKNQQRSNEALAPKTYDIHKDAASYPSYEMERSMKKSSSTQSLKNHQLAETENRNFEEELNNGLGQLSEQEISLVLESRYKEKLAKEATELERQRYQELQQLNRILDED